jgi:HlyD family secretion protein
MSNNDKNPPAGDAGAVEALLGSASPRPWWRRPTPWLVLLIVVLAGGGAWWWQTQRTAAAAPRYVTEALARGRLTVTVTANGTLQPTNKVDIGSELSGTVARVLVDVNDRVKKGQVLAELDSAKLGDQVVRSSSALAVAQAKVRVAEATLADVRGNDARLKEVARLSGGKVPSQAELASATAALARVEAELASARASVADAGAALSVDRTNLRKASIRSPIDGVVLSRSVDPGNAVAASLQAVTLFTLAEDLKALELAVNVDEADVGRVRAGLKATFTVSAYPNRDYPATVKRVAYGSTIKDNVVTYVAELAVDNDDLTLRPGMTATAVIVAAERNDVLLVPSAALRFNPASGAANSAGASSLVSRLLPRPPAQAPRRAGVARSGAPQQLWILQDGAPVAVPVTAGASDGRMTEVSGERLQAGMAVIVDQARSTAR